jgi:hypothetical protein
MDERPTLPCAQMLIGTTMALMTAFANPHPEASVPAATQRRLMARKIVSNLFFLKDHPAVGRPLREVLLSAHALWVALATQLDADADAPGPRQREHSAEPLLLH